MPVFERAGQTSLFSMLGGYGPSRAVNPSEGNDPVSLGLFPSSAGAPVSREIGTLSGSGVPALLFDEPDMAVPLAQERPMAPIIPAERVDKPQPPPAANMLLLDDGRVSLNGRVFMLPAEAYETVIEAVLSAYEADRDAELEYMRNRMQPFARTRPAVRKTSRKAAVVRRVQKPTARKKPAKPRPAAAPNVQPLPEPPSTE